MAKKLSKADKIRRKLREVLPKRPNITCAEFVDLSGIETSTDFYRLKREIESELLRAASPPTLEPTMKNLPHLADLLVQMMTAEGMTVFSINLDEKPRIEYRRVVEETIELAVGKE